MTSPYKCSWSTKTELESIYHDTEWGIPVSDDKKHFEMITLEGAQAGLSWHTILTKRAGYKKAFKSFDPKKIMKFEEDSIEKLLINPNIVRHKQKIVSVINNAHCFHEIQKEYGSFNNYIWEFVNFTPINNNWKKESEIPASTDLSDAISKNLKKKGFKFVGTTTIYAYMQAVGLVNDHVVSCDCYKKVLQSQKEFKKKITSL